LQVDGPGETDNEADDPVVPPPVQTKPTQLKPVTAAPSDPAGQQDSAQIAKKIKDLIHLKGVAHSVPQTIPLQSPITEKAPLGEIDLQRSDSVDSIKRGSASIRSASQASLSGKVRMPIRASHFYFTLIVCYRFLNTPKNARIANCWI
jgi:hypothetical protein